MDQNIIGETLESAVPWSDVIKVRKAVTEKLKELHKKHHLPESFCSDQDYLRCIIVVLVCTTQSL